MDSQTQRDYEEWSKDKPIEPMTHVADIGLLKDMWAMYLRQKGEEEASGVDTAADIEIMRGMFGLAKRGELTLEVVEDEYGGTDQPLDTCPTCGDTGWFFNLEADFKSRFSSDGRHRFTKAPAMED